MVWMEVGWNDVDGGWVDHWLRVGCEWVDTLLTGCYKRRVAGWCTPR